MEGLILLLDTGHTMTNRVGNTSYLQSCVDIMQMIVQRKMFQASKDEIGLVLFGTNETDNPLYDASEDQDHYAHIKVARELSLADWSFLKYMQTNINASNVQGDMLDALVVASDHFRIDLNKKKSFKEKRIILFTDFSASSSSNDDPDSDLKTICNALAKNSIRVDVISPFSGDDDDDDGDNGDEGNNQTASASANASNNQDRSSSRKEMTSEQKANRERLIRVLEATGGAMYSFEEALTLLSQYQAKAIKSTGTKFTMTIGESLKLPVQSIIKIKENKPEIFRTKKVYAKDDTVELKTDRARFTKDEEQRDLDEKTDVIDAYRYGSSYVPIDSADSLRLSVEKCFGVLGFTKASNVKRHYFVGDSVNQIVPDVNAGANVEAAFVNLVHAMFEDEVYGIVRKVFSSRSNPEVGCLIPYIGVDTCCLFYIAMPYEDDVRKFTLENFTLNKKRAPTADQLRVVDELIDCFDLQKSAKLKANDSGNESGDGGGENHHQNRTATNIYDAEEDLYDPEQTFNPYIQRMFQCIAHRAADPNGSSDELLSNLERNITNVAEQNAQQKIYTNKTLNVLKRLNETFGTSQSEQSAKRQKSTNLQNLFESSSTNDNKQQAAAANNVDDDEEEDMKDLKLNDILRANDAAIRNKKIGSLDPANDFKLLVNALMQSMKRKNRTKKKNDEGDVEGEEEDDDDDEISIEFSDYCQQLQRIIRELFNELLMLIASSTSNNNSSSENEPLIRSLQEKIYDSIRCERDYCVKLKQFVIFNSFVRSFRSNLLTQIANKPTCGKLIRQFWLTFMVGNNLTLIGSDECIDSDVSKRESVEFLSGFEDDEDSSDSKNSGMMKKKPLNGEEEEEDLLDLM